MMAGRRTAWSSLALAAASLTLASASVSAGQSAAPAVDLSGSWTLDTHLTDHPEQIARAIQFDTGEFPTDFLGRGTEPGRGGRNRATGEGRSTPDGERVRDRMSEEDRKLLAELVRPVQFPPTTLMIGQTEATVTITAGKRPPDSLRTDGKVEKQTLEVGTINRTAKWQGLQLHVTCEVARAGALTYDYSIVPTTRQLLIRVNFERVPGQPGPFEVKLVYNRAQ